MKKSLNIFIADDHPIYVEGLRSVLSVASSDFEYNIIGVARSAIQLLQTIEGQACDVLLMDTSLPDMDTLKVLPAIRRANTTMRILVLTAFDDPKLVKAAFKAGADGYILKIGQKDELMRAIAEIMLGNTFFGKGVEVTDRNFRGGGVGFGVHENRFAKKNNLTKREMEVLRFIGQALSNKDISSKMFISDQTVSVHRKNIMRKLGVNNTANLIKIAYDSNIV